MFYTVTHSQSNNRRRVKMADVVYVAAGVVVVAGVIATACIGCPKKSGPTKQDSKQKKAFKTEKAEVNEIHSPGNVFTSEAPIDRDSTPRKLRKTLTKSNSSQV